VEESWGFHRPEERVDWVERPANQWAEVMPGEGADMADIKAWEREVAETVTEVPKLEEAREAFKKETRKAKEVALGRMIGDWLADQGSREDEREREREMGTAQLEYAIEAGIETGLLSALGTPMNSLASLPDLEEVENSSGSERSSLWSTSGEIEWLQLD
jgi:hypothetical protein